MQTDFTSRSELSCRFHSRLRDYQQQLVSSVRIMVSLEPPQLFFPGGQFVAITGVQYWENSIRRKWLKFPLDKHHSFYGVSPTVLDDDIIIFGLLKFLFGAMSRFVRGVKFNTVFLKFPSIIFNLGLSYPSVAIPVQFLAYACLESLSTFAYWVENVNWAPWRVKMLKFRVLAFRRSDWRNCGLCGGFIYCFISYTLWSVYIFSIRFYLHFLLH